MEMCAKGNMIKTYSHGEKYDFIIRIGFFMLLLRLTSGVFLSEYRFLFSGSTVITTLTRLAALSQNGIIFLAVPFCFIRQPKRCIVFSSVFLFMPVANVLIFPESTELIIHEAKQLFISLFIPAVICMSVDSGKTLWHDVKLCGYFGAVLSVLTTIVFVIGKNRLAGQSSYDMSYSYALIVPALILMASFFAEGRILNMLVSLALVAAIILYGARGSFICYSIGAATMLVHYLVRKLKKRDVRTETIAKYNFRFAVCIVLIAASLVIGVFSVLRENSISTGIRFIDAFNTEQADLGRSQFHYRPAAEYISDEGIFAGDGLFSDRPYIYNYIRLVAPNRISQSEDMYGCYCHNILLELMFHFGAVGGIALFGCLVWLAVSAFGKCGETAWILCVFAGMSAALVVSGSYLTYPSLWILIGLCINILCKGGVRNERKFS